MNENTEVSLESTDGSIPKFLDRRSGGDTKESRAEGSENKALAEVAKDVASEG